MKTAIIASLIASAAAFAPAKQASFSTALNKKATFEAELGAQPPLGFFDPLGITAKGDINDFERLRYVEIKHGRICMLAVVGYLVTAAGIRLPGDLTLDGTSFADIPSGFAAVGALPESGLIQTVGFIGFLELFVMKDIKGTGNEHIGDFRNGALDYGWDSFDDATKLKKRAIELNQGRAAQMGILALMVHEKLGVSLIPSL
jgi:Chlorophyll A-B binding protein